MRVGFFCNMNNNFFSLVRYLRDHGVDAYLLRFRSESPHFHPECDAIGSDYRDYVIDLPWAKSNYLCKAAAAELRSVLNDYSVLVGCGMAPAYFHKAGRRADILIPYGGDVIELPYAKWRRHFGTRRWWRNLQAARLQRQGIREARAALTDFRINGPAFDALKYTGTRCHCYVPLVYDYVHDLDAFYAKGKSPVVCRMNDLREKSDFVVFHQSRHIWHTYVDHFSDKGNDKLIRGFHDFVHAQNAWNAMLVLFEYGLDVEHSKRLIKELSLERQVVWLPLCARSEVLFGLTKSDVAAGQFGVPALNNGATQEALICGKPLVHWRDDANLDSDDQDLRYPMIDAFAPEEISAALADLYKNPNQRRKLGRRARRWFKEKAVAGFLEDFSRFSKPDT